MRKVYQQAKMKDNCKFTGRGENISIPLDVCNDERLSDAAILLYGRLQRLIEKKDGTINISLKLLSEDVRKSTEQIKRLIKQLISSGYLRKQKTSFGAANSYALVDPLEGVNQDLAECMQFSNIFSAIKMQALLVKYHDKKKLLFVLEALEWQYRKNNRPVPKPLGLLHTAMTKGFTPDDDFVPGWWKAVAEKERKDKEAVKLRKKKEAEGKSEAAKMERWFESLSKSEAKERREAAMDALRKNGGLPKFGTEIVIKHKMYELFEAEKKKMPTLWR